MEPILSLGDNDYKDGEQIEYYLLSDYRPVMKGKKITLADISPTMRKDRGTLKYKKSWMSSRWVIINDSPAYERELNNYNVLNTNPFMINKYNILLLDSEKKSLQTPNTDSGKANAIGGTRKRRRKNRKTR